MFGRLDLSGVSKLVSSHGGELRLAHLVVLPQLEFQLDGLLQALESPFALVRLEGRYPEKLGNGILGVAELELLRVVVFVLDIDIASLLIAVVVFFVLEVVSASIVLV